MELTLISLFYFVTVLLLITLVLGLVVIKFTTNDLVPLVVRYSQEKCFKDPNSEKLLEFPFMQTKASVSLSIVVPAYNEESRLSIMLDETLEYVEERQKKDTDFTYEIIVVDDGSKDKTTDIALQYVKKFGQEKIRVLTFKKNRGKGGAVKMGVFSSRGAKVLMVDADGATKFSDLDNVEREFDKFEGGKDGMAVSVGSRAHLQQEAVAQCGFKLFTRKSALVLFSSLHVERWAFDVELLYIAQALGIPIAEVAVNWQEIDGSKMVPVFSWLQMGKDLLLIRLRYVLGAWKISTDPPSVVDLD